MLSRYLDPEDGMPRDGMFWLVLGLVIAGQLLAFYMLCSHQVRKAQARQTAASVERMASNDCLQYLATSTIASCSGSYSARGQAGIGVSDAAAAGSVPASHSAVPASYAFR